MSASSPSHNIASSAGLPLPPNGADFASKHDQTRRSSFNFLRRQRSNETSRSGLAGGKKSKGQQAAAQQPVPRVPPQLPNLPAMEYSQTNNSNNHHHHHRGGGGGGGGGAGYASPGSASASSYTAMSPLHQSSSPPSYGVPLPPMPSSSYGQGSNGHGGVDPYARTESMTHRGRYSYASSAISTTGINSPRRVRRRKDPTPFK
jgi:hypothetical protein